MNKSVGRLHGTKQRLFLCDGGESLQMDAVDQRIIAMLVADARASYAEIGATVALSAPAVKRRVDRLRATAVTKSSTALIDPAAAGWTTEAFVELYCTGRTTPAQLAVATRRHPE